MKKSTLIFILFFQFAFSQTKDNSDCVFNNDFKSLTSEAIRNYDKTAKFSWNEKEKFATLNLKNGDKLQLTLGGCYHFVYDAKLSTKTKITDEKALKEKLLWTIKNFFGKGYYEDFKKILDKKLYHLSKKSTKKEEIFEIDFAGNEDSNIIYDSFVFKEINQNLTKIEVNFYAN